jgi:iron complex outermembrane receptor protein
MTHPVPTRLRSASLHILLALAALGPPAPTLAAQDQKGLSLDSLLGVPVRSASKHLQTMRDAPASVTIVTADDIEMYGWTDLSQVLNSVGGFYASYDRNYTYLGVNGFGRPTDYNNRLLLLLDGHTLNEGFWGSTAAGPDLTLDLRSLERIEIVRGPGSVLYGNNAVFAVINLITKDGAALDGARLSGSAGSYGNVAGSLMAGTQLASGLDLFAMGLYGHTDGQTLHFPELAGDSATGGTIRDLDYERRGGAFVRLQHQPSGLWAMGRFADRKKGIPTASYDQIPGDPNAYTIDRWAFAELGINRQLTPALDLTARGYADDYHYEGVYAYDPVYDEKAVSRAAGAEAILRWDLGSHNRTTIGGEYRNNYRARYASPSSGPASLAYGKPYQVSSAYLQHEVDLTEWLTMVGGVRYDHYSRFGGHLTPRGGAVLHPDRLTSIKLLYGEAYRAPSISEASNGGVAADGVTLVPEEIRTLEALVQRQMSRGLLLTLGVFQYRMLDLIEQLPNPGDSVFVFRNSSRAEAVGAYAGLDWEGQSRARFSLAASLVEADDEETNRHLTNSPIVLLKAGVGIPLPQAFSVGVQSRYESGRRTLAGTETDAALLSDAFLSWRPRGRMGMEAGLHVNNIFDTEWSTPGGVQHVMPAIRQDGRNVLFSLALRF